MFIPSEKKVLSEAEIKANKTVIEELANKLLKNKIFAKKTLLKQPKKI